MAPLGDAAGAPTPDTAGMLVISHACLPCSSHDGCTCRTVAGPALGVCAIDASVWSVPVGAATPARLHEGTCVVLVLAGSGKHRVAGAPQSFRAPCTLIVPPLAEHEIVNTGALPLQLVVIVAPAAPSET
jgi:quercetin dioxygenase-like cupin family protein